MIESKDVIRYVRNTIRKNGIKTIDIGKFLELSANAVYRRNRLGLFTLPELYRIAEHFDKKVVFDILPAERVNLTYQQQQDEIAKLKEIIISLTKEIDELKNLQPKTRTK